jgi:hypothetical protein
MAENRIRFRADMDDKVSGKLKTIETRFDKVSKTGGFKALTQGVGLGAGVAAFNLVGAAISGVTGFLGESSDAARDMAETMSKSNVVFGSSSKSIEDFGNKSARSLGISKQASIEAAAGFGNLFTGLGQSQGAAAAMSERMVTLAADLASFNNLDPTETLDKLRAGLAGEAEPLRRVGVFLNEAKVKAKAMELGLVGVNGELTEGAKVTARYHLILEETTNAQGDFARTADGVANSQKIATAALLDAKAALGEQLLPAEKSVTEAQISLFTSLEAIGDIMGGKTTPETLALGAAIFKAREETLAVDLAALRAKDSLNFMADAVKDDSAALNGLTPSMLTAAGATEEFHKDLRTAKERSDDLTETLLTNAQAVVDGYYQPIEIRDRIQRNNSDINAAKRILNSKTASAQEKRDARSTITQASKDNDKLALELLSTGQMSEKEKKALLARVNNSIKTTTGRTKAYFIALRKEIERLDGMTATVKINTYLRNFASGAQYMGGKQHGGPVEPFTAYTVGEAGPETLVMGSQGGTVIPNGGTVGGNVTVNLTLNSTVPYSPGQGQQLAAVILPPLVRELKRQGFAA